MKLKIIALIFIIVIVYVTINSKPVVVNQYPLTTINDNYIYDNTFECNNVEKCIGINIENGENNEYEFKNN